MFVNATDVKNNFGRYLEMLAREDVIVVRNGKPVARLCPHSGWDQGLRLGETPAEYTCDSSEQPEETDELANRHLTFSQFMKFYEKTDKRYEYIDGKVWLMGAPTEQHQRIISNLHFALYSFLRGKPCRVYLAPLDVFLGSRSTDRNVVQPDLLVVCDMARFNEKGRYIGAPTLAIEVLSPSNRSHDLIRKMDLYLRSGVREYWTIDGESLQINIYLFEKGQIVSQRNFGGDDEIRSAVLEGLVIPTANVFE
jgi:prevent-host-death family protein